MMENTIQEKLNVIWKQRLMVLSLVMAVLFLVYYDTVESMVLIWLRSETFTHGFLILPISLYLIWQKRSNLNAIEPFTQWHALPLIALVAFGWLMASLADVLIVQQWAFVSLLVLIVLLVLGWNVVKEILFPLLYLYFAVPFGEQFITPMMHMTAFFVIEAIELTGIPIYSEGTFFSLPSGNWSVVEGCSGVRYLIASIALGTLYAYMTYNSYLKRSVFILAAIVFPILANWVRAFIIVMLGHFSDMKIATGVDHLVYGWVFFGIVLFIMFWVGSYWRDDEEEENDTTITALKQEKIGRFSTLAIIGFVIILLAPLMDYRITKNSENSENIAVDINDIKLMDNPRWRLIKSEQFDWTPQFIKPTATFQAEFAENSQTTGSNLGLYIAYYAKQQQGSELINSQNVMIPQKHPIWRQLKQLKQPVELQNQQEIIFETHLNSVNQDLIIWHWNMISNSVITSNYHGKIVEAFNALTGNVEGEYAIVAYSRLEKNDIEKSRKALHLFINDMMPVITESLKDSLIKQQ